MRRYININQNWRFQLPGREAENIHIPHTWNNLDGQDGGADYWRGIGIYNIDLPNPTEAVQLFRYYSIRIKKQSMIRFPMRRLSSSQ